MYYKKVARNRWSLRKNPQKIFPISILAENLPKLCKSLHFPIAFFYVESDIE